MGLHVAEVGYVFGTSENEAEFPVEAEQGQFKPTIT
jgi:hypothetical protein